MGFVTKTYLQYFLFFYYFFQIWPPELLWLKLMTKLLLDMLHHFVAVSALWWKAQWKSLSHPCLDRNWLSGLRLSNSIPVVSRSQMWQILKWRDGRNRKTCRSDCSAKWGRKLEGKGRLANSDEVRGGSENESNDCTMCWSNHHRKPNSLAQWFSTCVLGLWGKGNEMMWGVVEWRILFLFFSTQET